MNGYRPARDQNIDLLRAAAIVLVVAYHIVWWTPLTSVAVRRLAQAGAFGVDLFFVLSGFLIGAIFWREERDSGTVALLRFLRRRWLRTVPPYLVALACSWGVVWITRRTPFDPRYLIFLQNYGHVIDYFSISWSLCVEEHFYLVAPLAMSLTRACRPLRPVLLAIGLIAPLLFRIGYAAQASRPGADFGFYVTATHVHVEGLSLGMALAWSNIYRPDLWDRASRWARRLIVPLLIACGSVAVAPAATRYIVNGSSIALLCGTLLLALAGQRTIVPRALARPVRAIAVTSYSVYLVHVLATHLGDRLRMRVPAIENWMMLIVWPLLIAVGGAIFYRIVERGSLALRDRIAPSPFAGGALAQHAPSPSATIARSGEPGV